MSPVLPGVYKAACFRTEECLHLKLDELSINLHYLSFLFDIYVLQCI